jgi:uncharacterized membrane protein YqgA involved in biofilm formation
MIVRHTLNGRRRIFPSSRHSLSFCNFNLNLMVGSDSGSEILRSPWFQLTYSSLCGLLYCVGAMAIVGSLESGLTGNHQTLFAKSILDGIGSIIFASTLGIGVLFSAVSVFVYQGIITITASSIKHLLLPEVVSQMSAVGGLLIVAIGISLLEIKTIKIGNMLPAIFIPLVYQVFKHFYGMF